VALKALVVDRPWIGKILDGEKDWEMRSRGTAVRGQVALIEKGTGTVVGLATVVDSLPALSIDQVQSHFARHRVPGAMVRRPGFKWFTPWVLADVRRLGTPVPYRHPLGAVTWVNLSPAEEAAVLQSATPAAPGPGPRPPAPRSSPTPADLSVARGVVSRIGDEAGLRVPGDASTRVRRHWSKLYIDVEWVEGPPARRRHRASGLRDAIGLLGIAASALCYAGAIIHFVLAVLVSGITLLGALKWIGAMFVAMLVAVVGGRGDDLEEIFGKR
jgi:hypothetical protein